MSQIRLSQQTVNCAGRLEWVVVIGGWGPASFDTGDSSDGKIVESDDRAKTARQACTAVGRKDTELKSG